MTKSTSRVDITRLPSYQAAKTAERKRVILKVIRQTPKVREFYHKYGREFILDYLTLSWEIPRKIAIEVISYLEQEVRDKIAHQTPDRLANKDRKRFQWYKVVGKRLRFEGDIYTVIKGKKRGGKQPYYIRDRKENDIRVDNLDLNSQRIVWNGMECL